MTDFIRFKFDGVNLIGALVGKTHMSQTPVAVCHHPELGPALAQITQELDWEVIAGHPVKKVIGLESVNALLLDGGPQQKKAMFHWLPFTDIGEVEAALNSLRTLGVVVDPLDSEV